MGLQRGSQQRGKIQFGKSLVRCGVEIVGRNIGATTERLCGSKESLGFSLKVLRFCKRNKELKGAAVY